jgi:hypothetical protein
MWLQSSKDDAQSEMISERGWLDGIGVTGTFLSAAGLVISIFTLRAARNAREAAQKSLHAARGRNAADVFAEMANHASSLLNYVQQDNELLASVRASDLFHLLPQALNRWNKFIDPSEGEQLQLVSQNLGAISRSLTKGGIPDPGAKRDKLVDRCHEIVEALSRASGKMQSVIEEINNE